MYASEFQQLACHVQSNGQGLCDHFHRGFCNNVKNLLLNFPERISLPKPTTETVNFDNRLFELRQEEQATSNEPLQHRHPMTLR
jgi:hypothetical protein